ncbi:MAG: N-acetylmuramoyl-L-alanine amidase [Saprospiraceae bacterium]|nr:MAG: N-acetylmuramoyl-L-alanine amidase [Saprospiraceae bacterium]
MSQNIYFWLLSKHFFIIHLVVTPPFGEAITQSGTIMLMKIVKLFSDFFASLFGKKKRPAYDKLAGLAEDGSDVPDGIIVTVKENEVDIKGPFADDDKDTATGGGQTPVAEHTTGGTGTTEPPATGGSKPPVTATPATTKPPDTTTPATTKPEAAEPKPVHKARYLWCLDNGHGKMQPGKRSPVFDDGKTQFFEYEFNRDVVERIIKALKNKGVKYYDVVPDYLEVGSFLPERVKRANDKKSDLPKMYVSVHSNAGPVPDGTWANDSISGIETWFAQGSKKGEKMAAIFQRHLIAGTGWKNRNLKSTAITKLYVLVKTSMPAILTENGFYNNKKQVKELMKDEVRQKIADAHVAAILEIEKNGV